MKITAEELALVLLGLAFIVIAILCTMTYLGIKPPF